MPGLITGIAATGVVLCKRNPQMTAVLNPVAYPAKLA